MYAAAGGASLASRQARQRQRQNKKSQAPKAATTNLPPKQPQQYPNYTDQAIVLPPRLSRVERNALRPAPPLQQTAVHDNRRHSTSHYHLTTQRERRMRESPSICIPVQQHRQQMRAAHHHAADTPGAAAVAGSTLQLPQVHHLAAVSGLERRCSFVRQVEEMERPHRETGILDRCNHMCNFEVKPVTEAAEDALLLFAAHAQAAGLGLGGDYERGAFGGSMEYPFSECSQGRAAWVERERGRRCSVSDEAARQQRLKQSEAHHRWMKRNRIHDTSYGGSSDGYDDDYSPSTIAYHQSAAANALLYVGLGTAAIGSIIFFVGTGEKGFKTLELRLIGPTLVACGLLCCLVRILLCTCPTSTCNRKQQQRKLKQCCLHERTMGAAMAGVTSAMLPPLSSAAASQLPKNKCKGSEEQQQIRPCQHNTDIKDQQQQQQRSKKKVVCITIGEQQRSAAVAPMPQPSPSTSAITTDNCQQLQLIIPTITTSEQPTTLAQSVDMVELVPLYDAAAIYASPPPCTTTTNSSFFDTELTYDLQSVSDDDNDEELNDNEQLTVIEVELPKHSRTREPTNTIATVTVTGDVARQPPHSGIVLSAAQLQGHK